MTGSIWQWDIIAANNATADGDINWQESQAPDTVNNSARQMMGRLAELLDDLGGLGTVGGSANAITLTAKSAFTALVDGLIVAFKATANNTAAVTLNANSLGAKAIRKMNSTGDVDLAANEIRSGGRYILIYDTTANGAAGAWLLVNPVLSDTLYSLSAGGATARSALGFASSSTNNAVVKFNGTTGQTQNSGVTIDNSNNIVTTGTITVGT